MTAAWMLLEVTAILALSLIGTRFGRRTRAAVRHVVLASAFAVLLVLPFASTMAAMIVPAIRIEVPASVQEVIAPTQAGTAGIDVGDAGTATSIVPPAETVGPSISRLLLGGWIAGTVVFLVPVVVGLMQVRSLRRSGVPWHSGVLATETLASEGGVHRPIDMYCATSPYPAR